MSSDLRLYADADTIDRYSVGRTAGQDQQAGTPVRVSPGPVVPS
ncbi:MULTISPECIES: hypothetical protein [Streptomyces]|nr:hypothetical protein [Streptomyces sp. NEAU-383]